MKKILILCFILCTMSVIAQAEEYKVAYIARAQADSFAAWLANSVKAEAEK